MAKKMYTKKELDMAVKKAVAKMKRVEWSKEKKDL